MPWIKLASLIMFLGVALGAFGAHALRDRLDAYQLTVFKTAALYQFIHGLGLFVVAWLSTLTADPKVFWSGVFLTVGVVLFSGSLYLLAVTGIKWLGAITPLGGLSFLIGWFLMFMAAKG